MWPRRSVAVLLGLKLRLDRARRLQFAVATPECFRGRRVTLFCCCNRRCQKRLDRARRLQCAVVTALSRRVTPRPSEAATVHRAARSEDLARRAESYVYFNTSSNVVSPLKTLRNPSWRSVTIPSSIAFCFSATVGARSLISSRSGSVIFINS